MPQKDLQEKDSSKSKIKFLADEDVDTRLVKSLIDKCADIEYAEKGAKNSKLYKLACGQQRA